MAGEPLTDSGPSWRWLLLALWAAACLWLVLPRWDAIAAIALPDTDDNLRLLQVRDWLSGQGWFDLRQYCLDPPGGADIHWSRLVDLPLAAIILLLSPILSQPAAESVAVAAAPLLALLAAMALLAVIARRIIAPDAWAWAAVLLLMASPALGMLAPLRIDHHGWQIVALLATVWGLIDPARRRGGIVAGVAMAASLAIGVELLPYLAIGATLAAAAWIGDAAEGERLRWIAISVAATTMVAMLAFVPPPLWLAARCDALSFAYALPIVAGAVAIGMAARLPAGTPVRRGALAAIAGLVALGILFAVGGNCLADPYGAVDPAARRLWLDVVNEAKPLLSQSTEVVLGSLALPLIGLAGVVLMLARARREGGEMRPWLLVGAIIVAAIALSLAQTRAAVTAQALAVPGVAALGWAGRRRLARSPSLPVRVFGTFVLFLIVSAIIPRAAIELAFGERTSARQGAAGDANAACMAPRAIAALDALPAGLVLAPLDATPALLLHSHHAGLAGPYHRNGRAIADLMTAWAGDDATARAILRRHRVRYVLMCGAPSEFAIYRRRAPAGLSTRLQSGVTPAWLFPIELRGTPWRAWRVAD